MKKILAIAVLSAMISSPVLAGGYGKGSRSNADANADSWNSNESVSISQSQGGAGGRANQDQGQGQSQGANNDQGQYQGQSNEDLVNVDLSNHSRTHVENQKIPASQAYAPGLVVGVNEVCMGSTTAGGQGASFGISLGSSWTDKNCVRRKDARFLANMGFRRPACELMAQKSEIAKAFRDSGINCAEQPYGTALKVEELPPLVDKAEPVMGSNDPFRGLNPDSNG